jgi:hypothetical protein
MSTWTKVVGAIRFDGIAAANSGTFARLSKHLGKTCSYKSSNAEWDACTVPCGSEGSIQYQIVECIENQNDSDSSYIGKYDVLITGNLRDFGIDEVSEIVDWWDKITTDVPAEFSIRDAVLKVSPADGDSFQLVDKEDKW